MSAEREFPIVHAWQYLPNVAAVQLTERDGGYCFIWCAVPGGRPMFGFRLDGPATRVEDAPACASLAELRAFVVERFCSRGDGLVAS